ncbi:sugar transferase [Sulfitobacter pontiacus]|uniref:sugar transferase n=1 Tax=Sulfitobacter pontiacus TaxID=60137 RepID=UPI00315A398D
MKISKKAFDVLMAMVILLAIAPIMIITAIIIAVFDGRPILYVSERMKSTTDGFPLLKFRTMKPDLNDSGVSGGDKSDRITKTGPFLRRTRLDETPQLFNILAGHISFIGPRPPLRQYVERFPRIYEEVLKNKPGVSGIASIYFHAHEEALLSRSRSREETDRIYCDLCIPRKAQLDKLYSENQSICFDVVLMFKTVFTKLR